MTTAFMILYAVWDLYLLTVSSIELQQNEISHQTTRAREILAAVEKKMQESPDQAGTVLDTLQILVQTKQLGFYMVKQNRMPAATSFTDQESLNFHFESDGQARTVFENQDPTNPIATYVGSKIDGKELIVGNFLAKDYIAQLIASNRTKIWIDLGVIFVLISSIALYYLWDFIQLRKRLRKGNLDQSSSKSLEAQVVQAALHHQQKNIDQLKDSHDLLTSQVLPSLKKELANVDLAPYDFDCVFVRTDINKYSNLVNSYPHEVLDTVFNDFFFRSAELVNRYGGYCHEVIGDEILYYFKSNEHDDALLMAIACVRDIHQLSETIHKKTVSQYGFDFTVKSALDQGQLRFKKNFHAYSLSGVPFISTVRILSQIEEKETCQLYLTESLARTNPLCQFRFVKSVQLKGFEQSVNLVAAEKFVGFQAQLAKYYRADQYLIAALQLLQNTPLHQESEISDLLSGLTSTQVLYPPYELIEEVSKFLAHTSQMKEAASPKLISAILSLITKLIPPAFGHEGLRDLIWPYLKHPDGRVKANALDALTYYQFHLNMKGADLRKVLKNNRALANAIINETIRDIDCGFLKHIDWMLKQESPLTRSSALYAIGAIAEHYRKHQPMVLGGHPHLARLIEELKKYKLSENAHEKHQAERALKKVS